MGQSGAWSTQRLGDLRVGRSKIHTMGSLERVGTFFPKWGNTHVTRGCLASVLSSLCALCTSRWPLSTLPGCLCETRNTAAPACGRNHSRLLC